MGPQTLTGKLAAFRLNVPVQANMLRSLSVLRSLGLPVRGIAVALVMVAATTSGCSSVPKAPRAIQFPQQFQAEAGQPYSVLAEFAWGSVSFGTLTKRVAQSVSSCMIRSGFVYRDPSLIMDVEPSELTIRAFWESTNRVGYGITAAQIATKRTKLAAYDPNLTYVASLPVTRRKLYWLALTGNPAPPSSDQIVLPLTVPSPAKGCLGGGLHQVLSGLPFFAPGIGGRIRKFADGEFGLSAIRPGVKAWEECMAARGVTVSWYDEAAQSFSRSQPRTSLKDLEATQSREISVAVKDAYCRLKYLRPRQELIEEQFLRKLVSEYPAWANRLNVALSRVGAPTP